MNCHETLWVRPPEFGWVGCNAFPLKLVHNPITSCTCNAQRHAVLRRVFVERDDETSGGKKRRQNVAHDVDFSHLLTLTFLPDHGVLEHVERLGVELTVEFDGLARVQHIHLTLRPHCQKRSTADHCRYTWKSRLSQKHIVM